MRHFRSAIVRILFLAGLATNAWSAPGNTAPDTLGRNLSTACLGCHPERAVANQLIPVLNGLPRDLLMQKLLDFRDETSPRSLMAEIAAAYSTAEIERIAAFLAALPRVQDQ